MARFKDKRQNELFQFLLIHPPYNKDGSRNRGSSVHDWFWKGYDQVPFRMVVKSSWAHVAWSAGKDHLKRGGKG